AFEIYGSRVTTPAGTGIAADVESGPCERGGIDGRWERQNDQAGKAKTQSSILVHGCSPATTSRPRQTLSTVSGDQLSPFYNRPRGSLSAGLHAPRSATNRPGKPRPPPRVVRRDPHRTTRCKHQ